LWPGGIRTVTKFDHFARRQGKQPTLPPSAARAIRRRYADGEVSLADLAEEYNVGRCIIHRDEPGE
jgi:hypothetical protein